jgi:signal transduction histidine kinase
MDVEKLQRIINRERSARKESEKLLELKSHELYETNQNLEKLVVERTEHLHEALQEIQNAMETRNRFLSNMSHEIRTPLNAIIGFIEVILYNDLPQKSVLKYLNIMHENSQSLLQIINDILDLAKLESGKFTISRQSVDIQHKLNSLYKLFSNNAKEKSLTYVINFSENFPSSLYVDETRIIQIVSNFLSNAIKFTPEGQSIFIEVAYNDETSRLKIEVIDTGPGIEEEKQNTIFNSFEQEDGSITRNFGGTGLGLSIAKQLIEIMHGTLIFKSKKGEGSTFGFILPAPTTDPTVESDTKTQKSIKASTQRIDPTKKVLVAEDNETNVILIEILLEQLNVNFEVVSNGELVVKAAKEGEYALILMDNQMPKLSGLEATKEIRKFNPTLPIVALSANALKEEQEAFLSAGMNGVLSKPIEYEKLKMILEKYVN